MAKTKNLKTKVLLTMGITGGLAILTGFGIFLGHTIAVTIFKKIVEATGLKGDILPYVVVLGGVALLMLLLIGIMIFILHKRFNLFKQLGKIYGFK